MLKKLLLTTTAFILAAGAALAVTGNQIGFPVVGGASYCGSFGNGGVCNVTVPAGPTVPTGNETIVANTNLPSGQNPQTVLISLQELNAGPYQYVAAAADSTTVTVLNTTSALIIDPAGTLTTYGVILPSAPVDGQTIEISSSKTLTALTLSAGLNTISNSPTALTISTTAAYGYKFIYNLGVTTWFRLQ